MFDLANTPAAPAAPAAGTTLMTAPAAAPAPAAAAPAAAATFDAATGKPVDTGTAAPAAGAPAGDPPKEGEGEKPAETDQQKAERVAAEAAEAAKNAGAPEKYEPFAAPEGSQLDATVMEQFGDVARELNLPQDKAQLLIDKVAPVIAQRQAEQVETMRTEWATQATADKEFGGDKLPENLAVAQKAMTAFATPELTKLLNDTGLGNHPEVIRFMVRAGKAMSEDSVVTGGVPGATTQRSAADVLYGGSALKK
jgi:antitoxin component HigA of HigAB toxin-antitoxin module